MTTFRQWCATKAQRSAAAEMLARMIAIDPTADVIRDSRSLQLWIRHGPRLPAHVRAKAPDLIKAWRGQKTERRWG